MSRPALVLALAVTLLALGCPPVGIAPPEPPPQPSSAPPTATVAWRMSKSGLGRQKGQALAAAGPSTSTAALRVHAPERRFNPR